MAAHEGHVESERSQLIDEAAAWLEPDGPVARCMDGFEARPQQLEMARTVARLLGDGGVGLIEAGTGTGKSLAYLIPAVAAALTHGKRVVVSTNTIHLQEQLLTKDVPLVQRALAEQAPFKAATLKGWANYICLLRLEQADVDQATLFGNEREQLAQLRRWAKSDSHFGSRDEIPFAVDDDVWLDVHAESDTCVRHSCPFYEQCFYFRARRRAQEADIVIANHHLVCADAAIRWRLGWDTDTSVLPGYEHVVFDEAHHLEDVATEHFGIRFSRTRVRRLLARVSGPRGVTEKVKHYVARVSEGEEASRVVGIIGEELPVAAAAVQTTTDGLFAYVATLARASAPRVEGTSGPSEESVALSPGQLESQAWQPAADSLEQLADVLKRLAETVRTWRSGEQEAEILAREAEALARRAVDAAGDLVELADAADGGYVYWLEKTRSRRDEYELRAAPVEVGGLLQDVLLKHVKTAVFTSATLSAGDEFNYCKDRIGLQNWPALAVESRILSPFDFRNQVLLCLPDDLPPPDSAQFDRALARALQRWLEASDGRAFILFTSYRSLTAVCDVLAQPLAEQGMLVLKQGTDSRSRLLQRFRSGERAVLFGTDSFWEGVDVPGDALSLVVIARLPFRVPTDPIEKARAEALEARGGDSFVQYSLPRAIMKFRQGFGRLIRTTSDKGAVIIADTRVHQRSYGRRFLSALPTCPTVQGDTNSVTNAVRQWLGHLP